MCVFAWKKEEMHLDLEKKEGKDRLEAWHVVASFLRRHRLHWLELTASHTGTLPDPVQYVACCIPTWPPFGTARCSRTTCRPFLPAEVPFGCLRSLLPGLALPLPVLYYYDFPNLPRAVHFVLAML